MIKSILESLAAPLVKRSDINFQGVTNADAFLEAALNTVYFWMGVTAVGFIVYAGYLYTITNGDPGRLKKAKDTLLYALIGVVVVLLAVAITNIVINGVG